MRARTSRAEGAKLNGRAAAAPTADQSHQTRLMHALNFAGRSLAIRARARRRARMRNVLARRASCLSCYPAIGPGVNAEVKRAR